MSSKFFETCDGKVISTDAIGMIEPLTLQKYRDLRSGWDDALRHTPYSDEDLKKIGFSFLPDLDFHEVRCWTNDPEIRSAEVKKKAEDFLARHEGGRSRYDIYFKEDGSGFWLVDREAPTKPVTYRFAGTKEAAHVESDSGWFLSEEVKRKPFVYRVHLMMSDGGMNCSHTSVWLTVSDYRRLRKLLDIAH